jgi:hypothetical protein
MASRIDYSQNRKLYVGTTAEVSVGYGCVIVDTQLILGGTSSNYMLDVAKSAVIGSESTASSATNIENKLVVAGKNNYSDGTTWYGSYGQILLSSNTNMTGSARQFLITNALDNNKFAIIRSVDASTNPVTNSTGVGVNSGTADFVINNAGSVGIGATSPLRKLHVVGNFAVNAATDQYYGVNISGGEGSDPKITIGDWHNAGSTLQWDSSARSLSIDTQYSSGAGTFKVTGNDGANTFLNISTIGNVGIGDTTNNAKLGVSGGAVKIKNIVSSSPDTQLRRNINIASFTSGGATYTGKLVIETPVMTQGAMGKFKISGWQYDESWDLTVSGYLRIGVNRGWQQQGGAILTGNPPFDIDEVRLCYNSTTNIFYIILGDDTTFWDYYASIVIDADSIYLDSIPTTGWDMEITTTDPSGLTSDVTLTNISEYGSTNAIIPGSVAIGSYGPYNGRLNVQEGDAEMIFSAASSARPWLRLKHNIAPVNGEEVGLQDFNGFNDADQDTRYAIWTAKAEDVTDGSEDGSLTLMTMDGGSLESTLTGRSGKVGIANVNPAQALDVTGKIRVTDDIILAQTNGRIDYDNGVTTGALRFWSTSGNTERMRISAAGDVGIGSTNPSHKLEVGLTSTVGLSSQPAIPLMVSNNGNSVDGRVFIQVKNDVVNTAAAIGAGLQMTAAGVTSGTASYENSLIFLQSKSPGNQTIHSAPQNIKFYVDNDGTTAGAGANYNDFGDLSFELQEDGDGIFYHNVGIGTTLPQSKLHIETGSGGVYTPNSNHDDITIEGSGNIGLQLFSPNTTYQYIAFGDPDSVNAGYIRYYHGSNEMVFRTNGGDHLRINSGGEVGIGGSAPSYLLDVRDGTSSGAIARFSAVNAHVIIESSTAGNSVLHFKPNTTSSKSGQFKVTAGDGYNFKWTNDAAGTGETIYMDLDTSTTGGGDLTVKGDIIAYGAPSDKKYKENIKPIESALDKAMQLQGVTFDWKDSESILDIKEDIGFIAQDVEKVLPELVRDSGKGNLSLRYQGITPVLLEAIKELKAEIDLLKSKPCNCNNCNCNI